MRASRMRLGALAAAAGLILALVLFFTVLRSPAERPTAEPAPRTTPATRFFGVTVERTVLDGRLPPAAVLRAVRGNGAGAISLPFTWSTVQPTPARRYDWGFDDRAVAAAAQAGLDVQAVLGQAPGWARRRPGEPWSPPRLPGAFAAWAGAAAARYGTRGTFWREHPGVPKRPIRVWQVWNEPVGGGTAAGRSEFWVDDRPALPTYAALLRATAPALRRADPAAQVVLAGLTGRSWETLPILYRAGARGSFDAVSLHPYTRRPADVVRIVGLVRGVLRDHGDRRKPILVTEIGYPPFNALVAQVGARRLLAEQPAWLRETLGLLFTERRRLGIASVLWHTWASLEGPTGDAFGLSGLTRWDASRRRFTPKPALGAFRAAVRSAG
jgi:hypothetical protein